VIARHAGKLAVVWATKSALDHTRKQGREPSVQSGTGSVLGVSQSCV